MLLLVLGEEDWPLFHGLPPINHFLGLSAFPVSLTPPHDSPLVSSRGFDRMPQPNFMTSSVEIPQENTEHWLKGCELPHLMGLGRAGHSGLGVFRVTCAGDSEDILLGKRLGLGFLKSRISREDCSFPQNALASGDFTQRGPRAPLSTLHSGKPLFLFLRKGHPSGLRNMG